MEAYGCCCACQMIFVPKCNCGRLELAIKKIGAILRKGGRALGGGWMPIPGGRFERTAKSLDVWCKGTQVGARKKDVMGFQRALAWPAAGLRARWRMTQEDGKGDCDCKTLHIHQHIH